MKIIDDSFWRDIAQMLVKTLIVAALLALSDYFGANFAELITYVFGSLLFFHNL